MFSRRCWRRRGHRRGICCVLRGAQTEQLEKAVELALQAIPTVSGNQDIHISQHTQRLLNRADKLTQEAGDAYVSTDTVPTGDARQQA